MKENGQQIKPREGKAKKEHGEDLMAMKAAFMIEKEQQVRLHSAVTVLNVFPNVFW